ncbi:hypothetical protein [Novosphingobium sp.]|uniref:DUF7662 domain-containing protein n=1 Tax=Novosphingobium sp. TaxID=1874826 RepID=UPI0026222C8E|nr:hypothetical protein [Novosphingobium sp.]
MGVYEPLTRYLDDLGVDQWSANFAEIERIIRRALPASAYKHRPWWANQADGNHSQSKAWRDAGWETREVDLAHRTVNFVRAGRAKASSPSSATFRAAPSTEGLWDRAAQMTGETDRERLLQMALNALIQREVAHQLARLGATMPDLVVPQRDRPAA